MGLRVSVIGAGHIGRIHMAAYKAFPDAELVAVCDLMRDRADDAVAEFGGRAYTDVVSMLRDEQIDAVSVCSAGAQNGSHHLMPVMQCFNAGKHVLCEKPLSNQLEEARAMAAKARNLGLYFGCDLNHRFTPQAVVARDWIETGRIGQPLLMNMTLWIDNPNDRSPWVHMRALHPHSFDVMRFFCGKVTRVQAFFNRAPREDGPDGKRVCWSNAQVNVMFESGAVGHLTGSYDANMDLSFERCEVLGAAGRFVIENAYERATLYPRHSEEVTVLPNAFFSGMKNFDETIHRRVARWVEQVSDGTPRDEIDASGEDGLAVQEVIEAAITSWEEERVVDVENG